MTSVEQVTELLYERRMILVYILPKSWFVCVLKTTDIKKGYLLATEQGLCEDPQELSQLYEYTVTHLTSLC